MGAEILGSKQPFPEIHSFPLLIQSAILGRYRVLNQGNLANAENFNRALLGLTKNSLPPLKNRPPAIAPKPTHRSVMCPSRGNRCKRTKWAAIHSRPPYGSLPQVLDLVRLNLIVEDLSAH